MLNMHYFRLLFSIPKVIWAKLINGKRISISLLQLWEGGLSINIDKKSFVYIGTKLHCRGNLHIIANKGGSIRIGNNVFTNYNVSVTSLESVVIEDNVTIANNVVIVDHDHDLGANGTDSFITKPVIIKESAWIGANAVVLKGVTIGKKSVVASGAVVNKSIPDNEVWGGVPARCIKKTYHDSN